VQKRIRSMKPMQEIKGKGLTVKKEERYNEKS
jgi:hypothetical protein